MTQSEFTEILDKEIRPFVSETISNAPLHNNKHQYVSDSWKKLEKLLKSFDFPEDTFRDLNVRYRRKIENEILRK